MSELTTLQNRVLELAQAASPQPVLFGGGALILGQGSPRPTQDIDLLWTGRDLLGELPQVIASLLRDGGMQVRPEVTAPAFSRLFVSDDQDSVKIDLVSQRHDATACYEVIDRGAYEIRVPSRDDLLADKLCAALSRSEPRDLIDIAFLLERGADLADGLAGAERRDAGFSALTLAWVLEQMPAEAIGRISGLDAEAIATLAQNRADLVARLLESRS